MSRVYVVSFAPSTEHHGVGGFEWYVDPITAEEAYRREFMDSAHEGGSHIVRLVNVDVSDHFDMNKGKDRAEITSLIDSVWLEKVESELSPLRQYIPPNTSRWYLPHNTRTLS